MTGKEGKLLLLKNFEEKFKQYGFVQKKRNDTTTEFIGKNETGFNSIGIDIYTYSPSIRFGFAVSKRINLVENAIEEINKIITINTKQTSETITLYLNNENVDLKLIYAETEDELINGFNRIFNFFISEQIPILNSFDDLRNIDNIINGENEGLWQNDSDNNKPFTLAHLFYPRRLAIARLCKSDKEYDNFIERFYSMIDNQLLKENRPLINRNDYTISTNFIIKYLKENIRQYFK